MGWKTQFISVFLSDCINDAFYRLSSKNHYQVTAGMIHRSILAMRFGHAHAGRSQQPEKGPD